MSASLPADGKIGGLLSGDRPSGSVTRSLEGLRRLWGGGGRGDAASLISSSLRSFLIRSKKQRSLLKLSFNCMGDGGERGGTGGFGWS